MKLLETFLSQVESLNDIKRVWFTSFNLSIEFFETYVLPIILGMDKPKNRLDYEAMQYEINQRGIDIRLFSDRRMIQSTEIKRTAVPVFGVANDMFENDYVRGGLFHPKVIYIQDVDDQIVLGAGSSNLTLSGWGRNQEVFTFRRVSTEEQAKDIREFFSPLFGAYCHDARELRIPRGNFGKDSGWSFCHSFLDEVFMDNFYGNKELTVWSPYFPSDISSLLDQMQVYDEVNQLEEECRLKVNIVPDLVDGRYIRSMWNDSLKQDLAGGRVTFYPNPVVPHDNSELNHGKLWVGDKKVALGSWNFTNPGANLLEEGNNVEAGIIFGRKGLAGFSLSEPLSVNKSWFMTGEKLNDEALELSEDLPFDVYVVFDWKNLNYRVDATWFKSQTCEYQLSLPDIKEPIILESPKRLRKYPITYECAVDEPRQLLANHYYDIYRDSEHIYRGVIFEEKPECRRVQGFDSLDDLLDSLITGQDSTGGGGTRLRGELLIEETDDDLEEALVEVGSSVISSYFRLFQAMSSYSNRLVSVKNLDELEKQVFTYPGCLKEFKEKLVNADPGSIGDVYQWFLFSEYNRLLKAARKSLDSLRAREDKPRLKKWETLALTIPKLPSSISEDYVTMVREECSYG